MSKYNPTRGMTKEKVLIHWIEESNKKFNCKFDYSAIKEISTKKSPIVVSCPVHGEFNTTFTLHLLSPEGCPECGKISGRNNKRMSFEEFIKRLDEVQSERDYKILSKRFKESSVIKNQKVYIQDDFGIHTITTGSLLNPQRPANTSPRSAVNPLQYFINKARKMYNYKYTYNNFLYKGVLEKSYITCQKHGDFLSHPNNHLCGRGCPECGKEKVKSLVKSNKEEFVKKCIKRFGDNKKIFNKVEYKCAKTKIEILCEKHGYYKITPNCYLNGNRCKQCANENSSWRLTDYINVCKDRKPILYKIRMYNDKEEFIKIGITVLGVKERYNDSRFKKSGYKYKVLKTIRGEAGYIWKLEKRIHSFYKKYKYIPNNHFQGYTECFIPHHKGEH